MIVEISDPVRDTIISEERDFDEIWAELGHNIKFMLNAYDPDTTWLNIYLSHDGRPSFNRTIQRSD